MVALLLIARFFAPEIQGYYYTFSSLLALQIFIELSLNLVILNVTSHEWSRLRLNDRGGIDGDEAALSRLSSLASFITKWYSTASILFIAAVGIGGFHFLSGQSQPSGISWKAQWCATVALAGAQLWLMPFLALLEGCNQVEELNRFRFKLALAESLVMWILIAAGTGLWVAAGVLLLKSAGTALFLGGRYAGFFRSLRAGAGQARISWREQIWPMQWRLAVQGVFTYLCSSLFIPVMFKYHGSAVAGQMGMTLQIASVIQVMALTWVQTKVPVFGALIARRRFEELDDLWYRASRLSVFFAVVGSLTIWTGVVVMGRFNAHLASRMLEPLPTALLLAANVLMVVSGCQSMYLRAHAREPFAVVGVVASLLIGGVVYYFGSRHGPVGASAGNITAIGLFLLPMTTFIWMRRRREWQAPLPAAV